MSKMGRNQGHTTDHSQIPPWGRPGVDNMAGPVSMANLETVILVATKLNRINPWGSVEDMTLSVMASTCCLPWVPVWGR